ncbi:hypothetical protein PMIN04_005057 [Paraphaeosphaeria minitans]|uniref:Uncharacterized protein n=1 Tax=Paraphaeosphaeria minitans TaxID=565426 RepID=A0A9P6KV65_9PLEO|nr:hypothetical protein PMIN01_02355 [Paraphaeosphaeria minitans]
MRNARLLWGNDKAKFDKSSRLASKSTIRLRNSAWNGFRLDQRPLASGSTAPQLHSSTYFRPQQFRGASSRDCKSLGGWFSEAMECLSLQYGFRETYDRGAHALTSGEGWLQLSYATTNRELFFTSDRTDPN